MPISEEQYAIVASRRLATDGMLWQTPVLSLTAQAFLFTIALGPGSSSGARVIAAALALVATLASIQLMAKHRLHEERDSHLLEEYEKAKEGFLLVHSKPDFDREVAWYLRRSSYRLWCFVLTVFAIAAVIVMAGALLSWDWLIGSAG